MKVLSKATIYGLRALIYVATKSDGDRYVNIGEISTELDISFHFLTKTFQVLTQNGILESHRGPLGGVLLKKPMDQIFLIDLVHMLEVFSFVGINPQIVSIKKYINCVVMREKKLCIVRVG